MIRTPIIPLIITFALLALSGCMSPKDLEETDLETGQTAMGPAEPEALDTDDETSKFVEARPEIAESEDGASSGFDVETSALLVIDEDEPAQHQEAPVDTDEEGAIDTAEEDDSDVAEEDDSDGAEEDDIVPSDQAEGPLPEGVSVTCQDEGIPQVQRVESARIEDAPGRIEVEIVGLTCGAELETFEFRVHDEDDVDITGRSWPEVDEVVLHDDGRFILRGIAASCSNLSTAVRVKLAIHSGAGVSNSLWATIE